MRNMDRKYKRKRDNVLKKLGSIEEQLILNIRNESIFKVGDIIKEHNHKFNKVLHNSKILGELKNRLKDRYSSILDGFDPFNFKTIKTEHGYRVLKSRILVKRLTPVSKLRLLEYEKERG